MYAHFLPQVTVYKWVCASTPLIASAQGGELANRSTRSSTMPKVKVIHRTNCGEHLFPAPSVSKQGYFIGARRGGHVTILLSARERRLCAWQTFVEYLGFLNQELTLNCVSLTALTTTII